MGTMSRFKGQNSSSTIAHRKLVGQRLQDVAAVIRSAKDFNRATRRLVYSLFRKHCRALGWDLGQAAEILRGVDITNEHPAIVQHRLLASVGLI